MDSQFSQGRRQFLVPHGSQPCWTGYFCCTMVTIIIIIIMTRWWQEWLYFCPLERERDHCVCELSSPFCKTVELGIPTGPMLTWRIIPSMGIVVVMDTILIGISIMGIIYAELTPTPTTKTFMGKLWVRVSSTSSFAGFDFWKKTFSKTHQHLRKYKTAKI